MYNTLTCVPSASTSTKSYGAIFDYICDHDAKACSVISANTSSGVYGPYSMCNDTQKLGAVLDAYYKDQNSDKTACDFNGQADVVKPVGAASSCSAALSSASAAASVAATATSGGGSGPAKSSNIAAPIAMKNMLVIGDIAVGAYVVVAMVVGAGMVML